MRRCDTSSHGSSNGFKLFECDTLEDTSDDALTRAMLWQDPNAHHAYITFLCKCDAGDAGKSDEDSNDIDVVKTTSSSSSSNDVDEDCSSYSSHLPLYDIDQRH